MPSAGSTAGGALADAIRVRLADLQPQQLLLEDQSPLHAGHAGARGGGHFVLRVVSARFDGLSQLQRHRLVYDCLATLIQRDIHALSMTLLSPKEASAAGADSPPRK